MYTCKTFLYTCKIIMYTCKISIIHVLLIMYTCKIVMYTWRIITYSCKIIMYTCNTIMHTCQIIMYIYQISMYTCVLNYANVQDNNVYMQDIYVCMYNHLLLIISMLWHRQAIFKSKGDKLSSSAECRIWTWGLRHQIASRPNARWQTNWAI